MYIMKRKKYDKILCIIHIKKILEGKNEWQKKTRQKYHKKNKHPHLDHIKFKDFSPSPRRHHKYYVYQLTLERGTNI